MIRTHTHRPPVCFLDVKPMQSPSRKNGQPSFSFISRTQTRIHDWGALSGGRAEEEDGRGTYIMDPPAADMVEDMGAERA